MIKKIFAVYTIFLGVWYFAVGAYIPIQYIANYSRATANGFWFVIPIVSILCIGLGMVRIIIARSLFKSLIDKFWIGFLGFFEIMIALSLRVVRPDEPLVIAFIICVVLYWVFAILLFTLWKKQLS